MIGIPTIIAILARWRVPAAFQRFLAYLIIIAAVCLLVWGASLLFRGWVQDGKDEAKRVDRIESSAIAREAEANADRQAANDKRVDDLTAEKARAEQLEAINSTAHDPGGDPFAELYKRVR